MASVKFRNRPSLALVAGLLGGLLGGGCGSGAKVPTTVSGLVWYNGYPLTGGTIAFSPDPERGGQGHPLIGIIQSDGRFELQQADGSPNVPPGWYRVAIADPPPPPGYSSLFPDFPTRLRRPDRSDLLREVKAGQHNTFEFSIRSVASIASVMATSP